MQAPASTRPIPDAFNRSLSRFSNRNRRLACFSRSAKLNERRFNLPLSSSSFAISSSCRESSRSTNSRRVSGEAAMGSRHRPTPELCGWGKTGWGVGCKPGAAARALDVTPTYIDRCQRRPIDCHHRADDNSQHYRQDFPRRTIVTALGSWFQMPHCQQLCTLDSIRRWTLEYRVPKPKVQLMLVLGGVDRATG